MSVALRLLILEDNPADVELIRYELRKSGFDVNALHVETEQDYQFQLNNAKFDIILSDFTLPQFNAMRALEVLQKSGQDIPFIVVTGSISEEVAVACMKQGASDYVIKDRMTRLGQAITSALEKKNSRDEIRSASEDLRKANRAYKMLSDCNRALTRIMDEAELLNRICDVIVEVGGYRLAWVGYAEYDEDKRIRPVAKSGYENGYLQTLDITWADNERGRGPTAKAIRTGEPIVIQNTGTIVAPQNSASEAVKRGHLSTAALPLNREGKPFGALNVYSAEAESFTEEDITLLTELADDLAFGVMALRTRKERQEAEEHIRYQASLLENVSDAVLSTDLEFNILSWSGAAETIYGWKESEVIGTSSRDVMKPQFFGISEEQVIEDFMRDGSWSGEVVQERKDGSKIYVFTSVSMLKDRDDKPIGTVAINRDITDYKRAELARWSYEEKFRTIFNESLDVIMVIDGDTGQIISVNQAAKHVMGYEEGELISQHFSILFPNPSEGNPLGETSHGAVFESLEFRRADNTLCPMDLTATLIPWDDGQAVLVTFRDASERRKVQEELFKAERMRVELEKERELLDLKENFISMVSHQFRTPLTVILTSGDLLERYHDRLEIDKRTKYHQQIRDQTKYMTDMMNEVLFISKAKAGKLEFNPKPMDLKTVVLGMLEPLQETDTKGHRFVINSDGEFRDAIMDINLLQHIILNLVSNAIKYTAAGKEIHFELTRVGDQAVIKVVDQGIGIPEADQAHLFEPFHRAKNVKAMQGTGLGLVVVKDSVTAQGGTIDFVSQEGIGTTFTVRLPLRHIVLNTD